MYEMIVYSGVGITAIIVLGLISIIFKCYHQVAQGTGLIRNGLGGTKVRFSGMWVVPIFHRVELMDLSIKTIEIDRHGKEGLVCKDNLRADIKVRFFVRVNNNEQDVMRVASSLGCRRASDIEALVDLFDAKFSEALKTVGKQFDFVELYTNRQKFKDQIIKVIGDDLNGYVLDDAAIDFLEQTPLSMLNPDNILDCEGIRKISEITANQAILSNEIQRDKEKTMVKQNVAAREAVLELERQQAEAEEKQRREIASTVAREQSAAEQVRQEEKRKAELSRIATDEEIAVAEENKNRQVVVAHKNLERTSAIETERVEKDRQLEVTERERIVALAVIEKTKVVEIEQKNIQEVIKQRMAVQRGTAEEEQRIFDVKEIATADREKKVQIIQAEMEAERALTRDVKAAEASKNSSVFQAEQIGIEAEAHRKAAEKEMEAKKLFALAKQAEAAAPGLAEAQVMETTAAALEKKGIAEAVVLERKALAEAKGTEAKAAALEKEGTAMANVHQLKAGAEARGIEMNAEALEKRGMAEARVLETKALAEAKGIQEKANAMRLLDESGRGHEEFKLRLVKEKDVELAGINVHREIASYQAEVLGEALKHAKIDIVGGDAVFFDKIVGAVSSGKALERFVGSSPTMTSIRDTFFTDPDAFRHRLKHLVSKFGLTSDDAKNLSVAALLSKLLVVADGDDTKNILRAMIDNAKSLGIGDQIAAGLLESPPIHPKKPGK